MKTKIGLLFIVMLTSVLDVAAQATLSGRVFSDGNGSAMEYVNVGIVNINTPVGAISDDKGYFEFEVPRAALGDTLLLRASYTGYDIYEMKIWLRQGEKKGLQINLVPSANLLDAVSIVDDKVRNSTFTQIEIERLENTVGPNAGVEGLLKTLPDVSSNNEMSSQYSVRGGSYDENLVYINGVEIYRPMLVRSGQQEGLSIINPDMVDHILFSPGGFDATYGDKLSSVLDITYSRPTESRIRVSGGFLGGTVSLQGVVKDRFTYSVGLRRHSNKYIFQSLDTKGNYNTAYTDLQGVFSYKVNDKLDISALTLLTHNKYHLIPLSQRTKFGTFSETYELDIYFDGQETDSYATALGALVLNWTVDDETQLRWITSYQGNGEHELYDVQSQYWLYEVNMGKQVGDTSRFDRGVGSFLEHARNYLDVSILASEINATRYVRLGSWDVGLKWQHERIEDRVKEWKWVDSAGYTIPQAPCMPGDSNNQPMAPVLQFYSNAYNRLATTRWSGHVQRDLNFVTRDDTKIQAIMGLRAQYYSIDYLSMPEDDRNRAWLWSPRLSVNVKPSWKSDILFRTAMGVYQQSPFYREMRYRDGTMNSHIKPQKSYQVIETFDWNFQFLNKPFKLTADLYYKYITGLIPYTIDNMRLRYDAENNAVGYATGLSVRLNGEFIDDIESWVSLSLMQTQEDIEGDGNGWIRRPTDQRFSFKLFFQDYIPNFPWWRMSLSLIYGSRLPVTYPNQEDRNTIFSLPPYYRIDWGNTVQLSRFEFFKRSSLARHVDDMLLSVEIFNLFNYRNTVSYIWVSDYENYYIPVPNFLTARQVNLKLTVTF